MCDHCSLIHFMCCVLPHQRESGDSKAKGNNMSGNNAPHGNTAQKCSACARVSTDALNTNQSLAQTEI